jgi:hypothetical protein
LFSDFQLFRPEYHWRDLISRNAHLLHQNWYCISFTVNLSMVWSTFETCSLQKCFTITGLFCNCFRSSKTTLSYIYVSLKVYWRKRPSCENRNFCESFIPPLHVMGRKKQNMFKIVNIP